MKQSLRISDTLRLTIGAETLAIVDQDGARLLSLPRSAFIHASRNSYTTPPGNNHYHRVSQLVEMAWTGPTIETAIETVDGVLLRGRLGFMDDAVGYEVQFREDAAGFVLSASIQHQHANRLHLVMQTTADERFYGFGEQFTYVEFSGCHFPLIAGEQGLGRGAEPCSSIVEARSGSAGDAFTTYAPIPIMVTSEHRAIFVETNRIVFMDVKHTHPDRIGIEVWDTCLALRVWHGTSMLEAITKHTAYTGRYNPLPGWAHGVIAGLRGGRQQVEEILERCEHFGVPVSALWIEDWVGRRGQNYGPPLWWRWQPNEQVYPDFKNWVQGLRAKGLRVLTYFNPFIADDESYSGLQEALAGGYLVRDSTGQPCLKRTGMGYGFYMVDLANRAAYDWLKRIMISTIRDYAVSGWMADYGEYLSLDCQVDGGISGEHYHQQYALDWVRLNREVMEEAGLAGDALIFTRCGFGTVNRHATCFWEGDQNVTWDEHDGLASSIVGLLSGGFSGIAINHSDIGGHTTLVNPLLTMVRSRELLWRWTELAVFLPVFRTHIGTLQTSNHQFYSCDESFAFFGLMARLHGCLAEYFAHLEEQAALTGLPLIRHTMLHDEAAVQHDLRYQFMLGSDLVVFPIWHEGAQEVRGYVPAGSWQGAWDGVTVDGGCFVTCQAPLGKPACFMRTGSDWGERLLAAWSAFQQREVAAYQWLSAQVLELPGEVQP
jgi:alpha-glucosidase